MTAPKTRLRSRWALGLMDFIGEGEAGQQSRPLHYHRAGCWTRHVAVEY